MFIVLSSCLKLIARVHSVHLINVVHNRPNPLGNLNSGRKPVRKAH